VAVADGDTIALGKAVALAASTGRAFSPLSLHEVISKAVVSSARSNVLVMRERQTHAACRINRHLSAQTCLVLSATRRSMTNCLTNAVHAPQFLLYYAPFCYGDV
jgi:hypothetical protein